MRRSSPQSAFCDRKITVMGLGLNQGGLGISAWLLRQGARLTITDLKTRSQLAPSVKALAAVKGAHPVRYVLGRHCKEDFRNADMIIQNPGVPRDSEFLKIARKAGVPIESDISIFFRLCPHPIVGVSGTKGKTTVTALLGAMLERGLGTAFVAGNIRKSPLDGYVMEVKRPIPIVLELSSWQLESLKAAGMSPSIAVLTNVLPDHLNRYDGMKDYAAAKELIYAWQLPTGVAIVPYDDAYTRKMGARVRGERFWASMRPLPQEQNGLFFRGKKAVVRSQGIEIALFDAKDVRMPGAHNLWNALLAAGAAYLRGAKPEAIRAALRAFKGVPHRLERVRDLRGVAYWNDTAATTPEASVAAMETVFAKKKGVLIAGGADKELVFGAWAKAVKRRAKKVILFKGTATPKMRAALARTGVKIEDDATSMREAVTRAASAAKKGEAVLLSPGCASFGIFINEFDRGDQFRSEAKKLR
ncbi:MAG: UDP-N-acetylmuramoyl-L-alanine--D-glutamate ligase [Patescibacteria group bacterium]